MELGTNGLHQVQEFLTKHKKASIRVIQNVSNLIWGEAKINGGENPTRFDCSKIDLHEMIRIEKQGSNLLPFSQTQV
jgi:hypothetical protein